MAEDTFEKLVAWSYRGEISGEVLFGELSGYFPEHAAHLQVLVNLERKMGAAVETLIQRHAIDPGDLDRSRQQARDNAAAAATGSWTALLAQFKPVTDGAIDRYLRMGALSPDAASAQIAEMLVAHEQSLQDFAESQVRGDRESSTRPVEDIALRLDQWMSQRNSQTTS